MSNIIIHGAREGNLKNISLEIPRDQLIVLTGLSGSGKSTLAVDVIFQECQRQYLEAMGLQGIQKPKIEYMRNGSPAVMIAQTEANRNPRSTVGTLTAIYTDLRMVYEKLAQRACPNCHEIVSAADCREETEHADGKFSVFMICAACGFRMPKLTRTEYSYNTHEGACPTCEGLGQALTINRAAVIDESLALEDGAVLYWDKAYGDWQISSVYNALRHYGIPVAADTPVAAYSDLQKTLLYEGTESAALKTAFPEVRAPKTVSGGRFEGVFTTLWRRMADKGGDAKQLNDYFDFDLCPECGGERLAALSRSATVQDTRLPQLAGLSLEDLSAWVTQLDGALSPARRAPVEVYLLDLQTKIRRIVNVGLGYLTLDRQTITLSGGELQRLKLAAALDCDLMGMIYIMDEPTIGLHPKDTEGMIAILKKLRDLGNTVIVIEHDPDVMAAADYIVDIGPGSGKHGGQVIGAGTLEALSHQAESVTAQYLRKAQPRRTTFRSGTGASIAVRRANLYNLQTIDVDFPTGCLVAVTGVSGSGKSTLVFEVLGAPAAKSSADHNLVAGIEAFDQVVTIEQAAITRMKRSNVATYSEAYTEIRKIFGGSQAALKRGLSARDFSFNTRGGRCENCEGLGYVVSNLLFFKEIEVTCPVCGGNRFNDEVLAVRYHDYSIRDVLDLPVEEALRVFAKHPKIERILRLLQDVGLGYLELGQTLPTLSGGEGQRLKLAKELINSSGRRSLYLMDEPTTGLHPLDVENFLILLNRMVDTGSTVIVVEHNQQVIRAADWVIDLGPEGGKRGGQVVFSGTPLDMLRSGTGATADYLRNQSHG